MNIRKLIIKLSTLFLLLSLSACSNNDRSNIKTISSLKSENASLKKKNIKLRNYASASNNNEQKSSNSKKTSNIVGIVQYSITSYKQQYVINKKSNYTDAEYNDDDIKDLGKSYYRITINYQLKNTGNKPFDLSTYNATILDDNNIEFNDSSSSNFLFDDNSNEIVQPNTATVGKFILLSKESPSMNNFKINISAQYTPNNKNIGKSGVIVFK